LVSVFLQSIVANTPVTVSSYAQFWFRLLLGAFACLAAMAIETVRQLQVSNPDPAYHQSPWPLGPPPQSPLRGEHLVGASFARPSVANTHWPPK